jgi:hypothetical protein
MGIVLNRWRVEDEKQETKISLDFIAGQMSVLLKGQADQKADQRAFHHENSQKIDGIAANTSSIRNDVDKHHTRITSLETYKREEVEPLVNAHKKRKWVWWGVGIGTGTITSPAWVPKIVAALNAVFP